jgi:uncharacterized membrane protein
MRLIPLILLISAALFVTACGSNDPFTKLSPKDGVVNIPISKVNDGKAHYYTVNTGGKEIRFFVLKSNDGVIRAAFDACDVCFPEKKGYRQDGDYMICNNCGQRFHESRINEVKGGCNPSPLNRTTVGDNLVITLSDIQAGSVYF